MFEEKLTMEVMPKERLGSCDGPTEQQKDRQNWFEKQSPPLQLLVLASGVFIFFGIHNFLQEAIMSIQDFRFGVMATAEPRYRQPCPIWQKLPMIFV